MRWARRCASPKATGPLLEPVRSEADIARLSAAGLRDRLAPVFETLRRLSADLPAETTLIGFAGAPWTVASYMIEGAAAAISSRPSAWPMASPSSSPG